MPATALEDRALGPDLARGLMLLCIALANSHYFLDAPEVLGGYPLDKSPLDQAVTWVISTFVDGRAFPLFGLLFGYGVAQVVRRNRDRTRRLLYRRALTLIAIGWVHAIFLYVGDIVAAYGMLLVIGAWTVFWRDRWLLVWAAIFFVLTALPSAGALETAMEGPSTAELPPDIGTMLVDRLPVQLFVMFLGPIGFACPFLLGLWAGRRRILERPTEHRRFLRVVAIGGIAAGVLGAQPLALVLAGFEPVPSESDFNFVSALHVLSGTLAGAGYAAAIALLSSRVRRGRVIRALAATGQRSLTAYLSQSLVWATVFTPFLLGLADDLSIAATALLATLTWLATVVLCTTLAKHAKRGPFETLLRRATYGRRDGPARPHEGVRAGAPRLAPAAHVDDPAP
ncbi:DUF418 domain-containing protein [Solirubrobacter taibaiensis]|nr:DUF418 domain-containing protein [Solirubrobacter taibaiensis]